MVVCSLAGYREILRSYLEIGAVAVLRLGHHDKRKDFADATSYLETFLRRPISPVREIQLKFVGARASQECLDETPVVNLPNYRACLPPCPRFRLRH